MTLSPSPIPEVSMRARATPESDIPRAVTEREEKHMNRTPPLLPESLALRPGDPGRTEEEGTEVRLRLEFCFFFQLFYEVILVYNIV